MLWLRRNVGVREGGRKGCRASAPGVLITTGKRCALGLGHLSAPVLLPSSKSVAFFLCPVLGGLGLLCLLHPALSRGHSLLAARDTPDDSTPGKARLSFSRFPSKRDATPALSLPVPFPCHIFVFFIFFFIPAVWKPV